MSDKTAEKCLAKGTVGGTEELTCVRSFGHQGLHADALGTPFSTEPTKQREGDQVLPTVREGAEFVQDRAAREILDSKEVGIQRYGTALQTFNGRDMLRDAYEESRDHYIYMTGLIMAREAQEEELVQAVMDRWTQGAWVAPSGRELWEELARAAVKLILAAGGPR